MCDLAFSNLVIELMPSARIDTQRLIKSVLLWLIVPLGVCVFIDVSTGLFPWLTIASSIVVLPLASLMVTRAALAEFAKVIQEVAPDEADSDESEFSDDEHNDDERNSDEHNDVSPSVHEDSTL